MFVPISNTPRDYAWGSDGKISALLGVTASGRPEAELWLGAHPAWPTRIDPVPGGDPSLDGHETLGAWIESAPAALGSRAELPFLLKVLAAAKPLSLQVHPTLETAARRFAEENAAGIPIDAPERNYRDPLHKPELILALEDGFVALCGVRPLEQRQAIVAELGIADQLDPHDVAATLADLLTHRQSSRVHELVERVAARAAALTGSEFAAHYRWIERLESLHPGDPGVVIALLLNLVELRAGEALYLPAGNLHAYLSGIGIEVMAASDNVLRGGLTAKHIDVPELLAVADTHALPLPVVEPVAEGDALSYRGEAREFELTVVSGQAEVVLHGPSIVLNLGGPAVLRGALGVHQLAHGEAVCVTPDEVRLELTGDHVVLAGPQLGWAAEA